MAKFTDITNHWAQAVVEQLADQKIVSGYLNGQFKPDAPMNRAEFAALLSRAFPHYPKTGQIGGMQFKDVPPSYWAYGVIRNAYESGFLRGYPNQRFQPTDRLTRLQALLALSNGLKYEPQNLVEMTLNETFEDADQIPEYARSPIAAAAEHSLVVNYPDVTQLRPNAIATRAEIVSMIAQARQTENSVSPVPDQYIAKVTIAPPVQLTGELRGVGLTQLTPNLRFFPNNTEAAIDYLSQFNFNTLYPSLWNQGQTPYPSTLLQQLTGLRPLYSNPLTEALQASRRKRIGIIGWLQGGLKLPVNSPLLKNRHHWIATRQDGSSQFGAGESSYLWLNPFHPEVQQFILDLVGEMVSQHEIEGIQLDSSFCPPVELGYDALTTQLYQQDYPGKRPPSNPQDAAWVNWRRDRLTDLLKQISARIKKEKPYCILSFVADLQANNTLQDPQLWASDNVIEELILYTDSQPSFDHPAIALAKHKIPVSLGVSTQNTSLAQIKQHLREVRDRNLAGICFFSYTTLMTILAQKQAEQEFNALFPELVERAQIIP
ncbi:glycoside hydrolase family 10 protein [Roseofilum capinflatum]|uniref:Family 10 glycosylhydrolase n=1 Tax=Roseofilum capinflatum BLCC-M114 TaxID=3022440 RepID=A0ABT7BAC1_9CYAN|nr:family 10 glycosylhydrolase [Roseofilum capinflatum]MDJ1176115.1 family 10 glycosylhydrolase [Roseofilum capinflatum BLCC-M114]